MYEMPSTAEIAAEADAAFEIAAVRDTGIRALIAVHGRECVRLSFRMGWLTGAVHGLQIGREIVKG